MENQQLFNLVVSVAGFLAVFIFYQVMQRLQKAEDALAKLKEDLTKQKEVKTQIALNTQTMNKTTQTQQMTVADDTNPYLRKVRG